jgi:membrane-bound lytic murein transglycosylase B
MRRLALISLVTALGITLAGPPALRGQEAPLPVLRLPFADWLKQVRETALSQGISAATLDRAFHDLQPNPTIVERDRTQKELILTVQQYVDRRVTPGVVRTARAASAKHARVLQRVEQTYGVPREIVVAIWGLESNFGRFIGVRPTIQALATLAWEGRRAALFEKQLLTALGILDRGEVGFDELRGSWAGAMGQVQFLPTSYVAYAQDFDGDGRKDIWRSLPDVFASIANYLRENGWERGRGWGMAVTRPAREPEVFRTLTAPRQEGCNAERDLSRPAPLRAWRKAGLRVPADARRLDAEYSLLTLGRASYLTTANYEAILAYNCAHSYALSVVQLSRSAASARPRRR